MSELFGVNFPVGVGHQISFFPRQHAALRYEVNAANGRLRQIIIKYKKYSQKKFRFFWGPRGDFS